MLPSYAQALEMILAQSLTFDTEWINIEDCVGKILAENIATDRDYPPFNRAAMDGIATHSSFCEACSDLHISETIFAGQAATRSLNAGECYRIMTGAPVPPSADIVIKIEDIKIENGKAFLNAKNNIKPFQHIAKQGEDFKKDEIAIHKNALINYGEIAVLASLGKKSIKVYKNPKVAIVSTGNEVKNIDEDVSETQIRDSNSHVIASFFKGQGINPTHRTHVADEPAEIEATLKKLIEGNEITVISGGVSAGEADFIPSILSKLGVKNIFHKAAIRPGKPVWFGILPHGGVVFALPGNPLSVQVACRIFIKPFLQKCFGLSYGPDFYLPLGPERIQKVALDEFIPVKIASLDNKSFLQPVSFNGSGDISATLYSSGIILHRADTPKLEKGSQVAYYQW